MKNLFSLVALLLMLTVSYGFNIRDRDGCNLQIYDPTNGTAPLQPVPIMVHSGTSGLKCDEANNHTLELRKRDNPTDMYNNAIFSWSTWNVVIQGFSLSYYSGGWELPPASLDSGADQNWLSSTIAYYVNQAGDSTWLSEEIGGGWTLQGWLAATDEGYSFSGIPQGLINILVKAACQSATDWELSYDNSFTFEIWSSDLAYEILTLTLYPTNGQWIDTNA